MSDNKQYKPYPDAGSLRASGTKKGPKSPDYWGNIAINLKDLTNIQTVDGLTVVKLSGWKKTDTQGRTYLSIAVDRFVPEQRQAPRPEMPRNNDDDDSDVPF
jgi:hypothetical protein